ncbi:MAG: isochorismatase family cysteine hydrolase [Clostridia bacterium]
MKILIIVDMQNDFIDGSLGSKMAEAIVPNVQAKLELYAKNGDTVIFTRDTHEENYLSTQEGKNLPVMHCIKGSLGWQISEKLAVGEHKIIDKPTFGSLDLLEHLKTLGEIESIELVGLCTDICVISNAMLLKARFLETEIIVDGACCAGVTSQSHDTALEALKMVQVTIK